MPREAREAFHDAPPEVQRKSGASRRRLFLRVDIPVLDYAKRARMRASVGGNIIPRCGTVASSCSKSF